MGQQRARESMPPAPRCAQMTSLAIPEKQRHDSSGHLQILIPQIVGGKCHSALTAVLRFAAHPTQQHGWRAVSPRLIGNDECRLAGHVLPGGNGCKHEGPSHSSFAGSLLLSCMQNKCVCPPW
eukprot:4236546-Amphidinium_carterae.1